VSETTNCTACGQIVSIESRKCPNCNAVVIAPAPAVISPPSAADELSIPSLDSAEDASAAAIVPEFPERMRANKVLAGRVCPGCSNEIELGDDAWNCQTCNSTMHQACYENTKCCGNPQCRSRPKASTAQFDSLSLSPTASPGKTADAVGHTACRFCGEMILEKAKKCKFCGEYQSEIDRKRIQKSLSKVAGDDDLTPTEIVFGVLCGGIACILSIVWMIQGKKKGWKLFLISAAAQAFFTMIRLAMNK
jgi:hypothetical protein